MYLSINEIPLTKRKIIRTRRPKTVALGFSCPPHPPPRSGHQHKFLRKKSVKNFLIYPRERGPPCPTRRPKRRTPERRRSGSQRGNRRRGCWLRENFRIREPRLPAQKYSCGDDPPGTNIPGAQRRRQFGRKARGLFRCTTRVLDHIVT